MNVRTTKLNDVLIIEPAVWGDQRGFFSERYSQQRYEQHGLDQRFIQDNLSRSKKGILRGLHFQKEYPQGKLVEVLRGSVYDVVVDLRPDSSTYKQWLGVELSEENRLQLWVPPGFAHGFCVLSDVADLFYKCTEYYHPEDEGGILWNDPELAIEWPITNPVLSAKDQALPRLSDFSEVDLPQSPTGVLS